jgi:hypothetical protein
VRLAAYLALGTALCASALTATAFAQQSINAVPPKAALAAAKPPSNAPHPPYKAPRLSFGAPDLQGYWSNASLTPITRQAKFGDRATYTEDEVKALESAVVTEIKEGQAQSDPNGGAEARTKTTAERPEFAAAGGAVGGYNRFWLDPGNYVMRVNGQPRNSVLTTPNGQYPQRKAQTASAAGGAPVAGGGRGAGGPGGGARGPYASLDYETRSSGERCVIGFGRNGGPPMFANGFYNNNYQIVQGPNAVMIETEMNHDARLIRMDSKTHLPSNIRPYFGDSIGWYEGDTLVVETTNMPRSQQLAGSWENLKVTERFTRVADDRVLYQFKVNDPTMWDADWGGEYEFAPLGGHLFEYACHEGNYALPGILSGNKSDVEKAEAKAAAAKVEADAKAAADAKAKPAVAKPGDKPAKN